MSAYYNEIDPYAAQWLRNLIAAGHIAPGDVDERSIEDVHPDDLRPYRQCHFFAGIGAWSAALRRVGWDDDRRIWTGSCPCQPFSAAGKGNGFDDERHLWPAFHWLISQCGPAVVAGEQVASKDGLAWLDLVQADMEGTGYAFGAVDTCAAGVGAPHIRQRLWWIGEWMADAQLSSTARYRVDGWAGSPPCGLWGGSTNSRASRVVGVAHDARLPEQRCNARVPSETDGTPARESVERTSAPVSGLEYPGGERREWRQETAPQHIDDRSTSIGTQGQHGIGEPSAYRLHQHPTGPTNGIWRDADWLFCRDGKWRPVEPGTFPLAHGATSRVGRLRAYGNAINLAQAEAFLAAALT